MEYAIQLLCVMENTPGPEERVWYARLCFLKSGRITRNKYLISNIFLQCRAFVAHAEEQGQLLDWSAAAVVGQNFTKTQRTVVEAAFIATEMSINTSPGFFKLAAAAANLI